MSTDVTTGTPTKRRHAPPPVRNLRPPKLKLPPGACDTHFHFLGPQREFPFNPNRKFVPDVDHDDSTIADWQQMQSALGLARGLLVQSMMYHPSYELALHALCLMPERLRAVVSPRPEITDRELEILTKAGVVGVRFTRATSPTIDDRLVHRTNELGWGMHYLFHDEQQMKGWRSQIIKSPGKFVIEHWETRQWTRGSTVPPSNFCSNALIPAVAGSSFRRAPPNRRRFHSSTCCQ
jgi:2-pyrone-4,6-dicarboxylate lactonase